MADQWNKRQKDQGRLQPGLLLLSVNGEEDHEEIMSLDTSNVSHLDWDGGFWGVVEDLRRNWCYFGVRIHTTMHPHHSFMDPPVHPMLCIPCGCLHKWHRFSHV